ncbi:hypothetical protein JCM10908_003529 [Rhodotorula pacifica]|uniref:uncharacterized protein n=1 Tax=Rhodotorula pacifica TaxID=1495444 RepID=UPI00317E9955
MPRHQSPDSPFAAILHHLEWEVFPRPTPGIRCAGSVLGVAASLSVLLALAFLARTDLLRNPLAPRRTRSRAPWSKVETPAGTLFLLDATRTFTYLSALGGLVFISGSAFWLLAPPSVTAHTAITSLVQVFIVLLGATAALASLQSVWRTTEPIHPASERLLAAKYSLVATNNLYLCGTGALAAVTAASGIVRTVHAHRLDTSFMHLRTQLNDRIAAQVEATPAGMLVLAPALDRVRTAANQLRFSVVISQAVNLAVAIALFSVCVITLCKAGVVRAPSTVSEAPIQLPPTPPAYDTKLGGQPGFFSSGEAMSVEEGVADGFGEEEGRAAKARDDLVLVCSTVGALAGIAVVTSALALLYAAVPELYWVHVTTRRSVDLIVPICVAITQLIALGFLLLETFRPRAYSIDISSPSDSPRPYKPLSTRMISLSKRGSFRLMRIGRGRRRARQEVASDSKEQFVLSDSDEDAVSATTTTTIDSARSTPTPTISEEMSSIGSCASVGIEPVIGHRRGGTV